jgi:hypothetical protein
MILSDKHKCSDLDRQVQKPINHPTADEEFMRNSKPQTESIGREDRNCLKVKVRQELHQQLNAKNGHFACILRRGLSLGTYESASHQSLSKTNTDAPIHHTTS